MATRRVLVNRSATVTVTLVDQDGIPTDATGTPTITATRLDGTGVTLADQLSLGEGNYSVKIAAAQIPSPDLLTLRAVDDDDSINDFFVDVAGGYYFSLTEARIADDPLKKMAKYPDEDLIRVREQVEDECERICGQAFVPRASKVTLSGDGGPELLLDVARPRAVRSISVGGVPFTEDQLEAVTVDPDGYLVSELGYFTKGHQNVSLVVEHGWLAPPSDLKAATIRRLRERLSSPSSGAADRTTSLSTEAGTFTLATPGRAGFETGNPDVDAVYARYKRRSAIA